MTFSYLEGVDKVGECEAVPEGLRADEDVEHGELVNAGDDEEEVDQGQVGEELVETAKLIRVFS